MNILMLLCSIFCNASANILMKLSMKNIGDVEINNVSSVINNLVLNPTLILGCVLYGSSLISYIFLLRKIDISIAYPILVSGSIIIVSIASKFIFNEILTIGRIAGFAAILIGIYLIVK